jgi:putative colanic acid biosynthesis acetyltransferase WcaF
MIKVNLGVSQTNWSLKIKLLRVLWMGMSFIYWPIFPKVFSRVRVAVARVFGAKIGNNCLICSGVRIWMPWNLVIKDSVSIGHNVEIYNFAKVTIGSHTSISQNTFLCSASHDYTNPKHPLIYKDIKIDGQCWLAAGVFIGPGVHIAEGVVVGAMSVVVKDLDSWTVNAGNPAVCLKKRVLVDVT